MARRGWMEPGDVLDTLPLPALLQRLHRHRLPRDVAAQEGLSPRPSLPRHGRKAAMATH